MTSRCSTCKTVKSAAEFCRNRSRKNGLHAECRACMKAYHAKNRESRVANNRRYSLENRAVLLARRRAKAKLNRAVLNARREAWCRANPDKIAAIRHRHYIASIDKKRVNVRRWRDAHREQERARNAKRKARLRGARVEDVLPSVVFARDGGICGLCREPVIRPEASLDHIIPIAHGGEHSYRNIQLAHLRCNLSKGARVPRQATAHPIG